jgi:hypothetical protein
VGANILKPDCWNKDGNADELEQWINSLNNLMYNRGIGDKDAYIRCNI